MEGREGESDTDFFGSSLYNDFLLSRGNIHWDLGIIIIIKIATSLNTWCIQVVNFMNRFLSSKFGSVESGRWLLHHVYPDCDLRGNIALEQSLGVVGALEGQKGQEESFGNHLLISCFVGGNGGGDDLLDELLFFQIRRPRKETR